MFNMLTDRTAVCAEHDREGESEHTVILHIEILQIKLLFSSQPVQIKPARALSERKIRSLIGVCNCKLQLFELFLQISEQMATPRL